MSPMPRCRSTDLALGRRQARRQGTATPHVCGLMKEEAYTAWHMCKTIRGSGYTQRFRMTCWTKLECLRVAEAAVPWPQGITGVIQRSAQERAEPTHVSV